MSPIREKFRARLKSTSGVDHRHTLIALAFARKKPYSHAESRVRFRRIPTADSVNQVLEEIGISATEEEVLEWMNSTAGVYIYDSAAPEPKKPVVPKLYVVVRQDLPPGAILSQAIHAAIEYSVVMRDELVAWHKASNTICVLGVKDEAELMAVANKMIDCRRKFVQFIEPDMESATTALCIEPSAAKLLRHLPLALSGA
jgi:hypothetical protein